MVDHSLRTNPYKMSIFETSVTCSFFQELCSHIDKNSGEKFEDMFPRGFLVKIASKGTFLNKLILLKSVNNLGHVQLVQMTCHTWSESLIG